MVMRDDRDGETVRAEGDGLRRRNPTPYEIYRLHAGITDDLTREDKLQKLGILFDRFAANATRQLDNCCNGEERDRRVRESRGQKFAELTDGAFARCALEASHSMDLLQRCVREMQENSQGVVNGTLAAFTERTNVFNGIQTRFEGGRQAIAETAALGRAPVKAAVNKITCALISLCTIMPIDTVNI